MHLYDFVLLISGLCLGLPTVKDRGQAFDLSLLLQNWDILGLRENVESTVFVTALDFSTVTPKSYSVLNTV